MSRWFLASSFALAVLSIPLAAAAQPGQPPPPPPPGSSPGYGYGAYGMTVPGVNEHEGFFLRLGLGPAYIRMSASDDAMDASVYGGGAAFLLALGGNVTQNLIIYGELLGEMAVNPTIEINDVEFDTEDVSAGAFGVGVGLAYYLPSNIYFSGTLAAAQLSIQADQDGDGDTEEVGETDFGPTFSGQIGKEWWVSDNWGLGLAGQVLFGNMKDGEADVTWTTVGVGFLFSATYD